MARGFEKVDQSRWGLTAGRMERVQRGSGVLLAQMEMDLLLLQAERRKVRVCSVGLHWRMERLTLRRHQKELLELRAGRMPADQTGSG